MLTRLLVTFTLVPAFLVMLATTESVAGTSLYRGAWIAESFGNDKVNIGTKESQYFEVAGIPLGANCHVKAPLCDLTSTPVTTTGTPTAPGANGTVWNPLGPGCRPLTAGEKPRPAKGGTLRPPNGKAPGAPLFGCTDASGCTCSVSANKFGPPCDKTPPLYRNANFFTGAGGASNQTCQGSQTVLLGKTTDYLGPGDPRRGVVMKGAPVSGSGLATTTGTASFKLPAALATAGPGNGMRRTTQGSFFGEGPYLYSYTYANLRNDAGSFGPGKGFFSLAAAPTTLQFTVQAGGTTAQTVKVTRGKNRFGGVMKLLGTYSNKVCYFYAGGCGLGYGTWGYQNIGAAGYKSGGVVTASYTDQFVQVYYNTALGTFAKYDVVEQRFPWTTGTVTVQATERGPNNTFEVRKGFDSRVDGVGVVQLVSPLLTQWLAQSAAAVKMETGGIAVMQIKFVPEPSVLYGLAAGLSLLAVMNRFHRS